MDSLVLVNNVVNGDKRVFNTGNTINLCRSCVPLVCKELTERMNDCAKLYSMYKKSLTGAPEELIPAIREKMTDTGEEYAEYKELLSRIRYGKLFTGNCLHLLLR